MFPRKGGSVFTFLKNTDRPEIRPTWVAADPDDAWDSKAPLCDAPLAVPALWPAPPRGRDVGRASSRGNLEPASSAGSALLAMAPALLLVPAALASFVLAFGTGVEFVRFTSLRPLLGGIPESGGPGEPQGSRAS